jgi:anti-sigma regulatory factor (Ser/Thr protein kinase)
MEESNRHVVRFPNSRQYVPVARKTVIEFARALGLPAKAEDDLTSAVGEALANAVEHGFRERTYFSIRCWREQNIIVVEIEDDGRGFDPSYREEGDGSDHDAERGFGISIMRALVDQVSFRRNGRLVRLYKNIG